MSDEQITFTIKVPDIEISGLAFEYRCGETVRWVKHRAQIARTDGPWHYCTGPLQTSCSFPTLEEAQREAVKCVAMSERARLIELAARAAGVQS